MSDFDQTPAGLGHVGGRLNVLPPRRDRQRGEWGDGGQAELERSISAVLSGYAEYQTRPGQAEHQQSERERIARDQADPDVQERIFDATVRAIAGESGAIRTWERDRRLRREARMEELERQRVRREQEPEFEPEPDRTLDYGLARWLEQQAAEADDDDQDDDLLGDDEF
jgi:hypothetical protein